MKKPLILVTNDDGIYAPGIEALVAVLSGLGEVKVVAPLTEMSAVGHAITLSDPLRVKEIEKQGIFFGLAVNGTPADCVKLALTCLLERTPDIIVSGINAGSNTATNVIYSGTVSAAAEGVIYGVPSIAVSLTSFSYKDFSYSARIARQIAGKVLQNGLPERTVLNINVPAVPESEIKGIRVTRQGKGRYEEEFDKRQDPQGRTYYWMAGKRQVLDSDGDVDDIAISENYVAITPIQYDLTHHDFIKDLRQWKLKP